MRGGIRGRTVAVETIREIHRRFSALLPDELLVVSDPETGRKVTVIPGELRREDVNVGQHDAISPGAVPRFSGEVRTGLLRPRPRGNHPGSSGRASSTVMDSPVRGRQRARGAIDVSCDPA